MIAELVDKYIWLVQTLLDAGYHGLTLERIAAKWKRRYGEDYPRRTFNNHREAIAELFGIEIRCRRGENVYWIPDGRDAIDTDRTRSWIIDTFTVGNVLTNGRERLSGRISVEGVPSGHIYLTGIISAMDGSTVLEIVYRKYTSTDGETLHVEPYAVKEDRRRWYLVGYCRERNALRVYSLDRILSLERTNDKFTLPEDFDVDDAFSHSFGMYLTPASEVRKVVLRCDERQANYLRDLPLHPSQREEGSDGGLVTFSLTVGVNDALVMELCSWAGKVEVLEPLSLRERLAQIHYNAYKTQNNE